MIAWASVAAVIALVVVAATRMLRRDPAEGRRHQASDPHWGDWPPDQMSP